MEKKHSCGFQSQAECCSSLLQHPFNSWFQEGLSERNYTQSFGEGHVCSIEGWAYFRFPVWGLRPLKIVFTLFLFNVITITRGGTTTNPFVMALGRWRVLFMETPDVSPAFQSSLQAQIVFSWLMALKPEKLQNHFHFQVYSLQRRLGGGWFSIFVGSHLNTLLQSCAPQINGRAWEPPLGWEEWGIRSAVKVIGQFYSRLAVTGITAANHLLTGFFNVYVGQQFVKKNTQNIKNMGKWPLICQKSLCFLTKSPVQKS